MVTCQLCLAMFGNVWHRCDVVVGQQDASRGLDMRRVDHGGFLVSDRLENLGERMRGVLGLRTFAFLGARGVLASGATCGALGAKHDRLCKTRSRG